jgi:hypothetical protein
MRIYQTSSIRAFNSQFEKLWDETEAEAVTAKIASKLGEPLPPAKWINDLKTVHKATNMADQYFDRFSRNGKWTQVVKTKPSSTFTSHALTNGVTCTPPTNKLQKILIANFTLLRRTDNCN